MRKPFIGITTAGRDEHQVISQNYDSYDHVAALYVDAVRRAGGVPFLLPPGDDWRDMLEGIDGIVFSGGADVNPALYGGNTHHANVDRPRERRDTFEISMIKHLVEKNDLPVLFICRGMQVLNVALGGTLYEHIPDVRDNDIHRNEAGSWTLHSVDVAADSHLAQVMESTYVETYSGHHQAVKDVAPQLNVVATAPDGIIEALELPEHLWLVAVQWHPEKSVAEDPTQQRLFDKLVQTAQSIYKSDQ